MLDAQLQFHPHCDPGLTSASIDVSSALFSKTKRVKERFEPYYKGQTLEEIARYGGYQFYHPPGNTDPYVRESMKEWNRPLYDSLYGKTRRGAGLPGMYKALLKFDGPRYDWSNLSPDQQTSMRRAIAAARKAFQVTEKQEPLDWHEVGQYLRHDTSAGVTWPGKKKGEVAEEIFPAARWLGHRMKQGGKAFNPTQIQFPPCLMGSRGAMSEADDPKTRAVWIYPAEMLVIEGLYAPRMYEELRKKPNSPLMNVTTPSRTASNFATSHSGCYKKLGMDFSSFDSSIPTYLIRTAFDICHSNVNWTTWRGKPVPEKHRRKWRNVWDNMVWYFINTPVLMPDGRMFRKHGGVPSGTFWTQMIDSIVNYILVTFLAEEQGRSIYGLKVLGDDSVGHVVDIDLVRAILTAKSCFGMVINPDKSDLVDEMTDLKLLGTHFRGGVPYRSDEEWFSLLLYPENVVRDLEHSMSRFVGLFLSGAMYSQLFCDFWSYFQSGYPVPGFGRFTRDQRRGLTALMGRDPGEFWNIGSSVFEHLYQVHH